MNRFSLSIYSSLIVGLLLFAQVIPPVQAAVLIDGTRVIYSAKEREVTVKMTNKGNDPVLMQVWVDRGDPTVAPQNADAPFLVTPPIFRLDPKMGQSVRLVFTGEKLPQDRESLFWFNALEVPPMPQDADINFMQIAVRSRLKLFYRPTGLPGDMASAIRQVAWRVVPSADGHVLRGENSSAYHLSFSSLVLEQGGKRYDTGGGMISPHSSAEFPLAGFAGQAADRQVRFRWMSDYGVAPEQTATVL
ncbi:fimbrial biogenesis chaperone [Zestomonas carbonaria]|uniref:Putative fimbrial chaperone YadV n=1 Tax=Zestomonas carbonaria TaxID=2762745 RepID=A0A7U7EMY5_9GAMM|nr:fimbria/pilus periplasmic chaperone [Pseudomonas carbonaria]CAD5107942.1 putative fimbrial chaperone YadV [Pseudomonas carbonaria]